LSLRDPDSNNWDHINIRLVGTHPLWGHYLYANFQIYLPFRNGIDYFGVSCRWNAARSFATYLDADPKLYRNQSVLELGAGGGLPGIVAAKNGARMVSSCLFFMNRTFLEV
jgi:nicotinamide N-methyltransferase